MVASLSIESDRLIIVGIIPKYRIVCFQRTTLVVLSTVDYLPELAAPLALERVALADNGYLIRDIAEMGSLSCLLLTRSTSNG